MKDTKTESPTDVRCSALVRPPPEMLAGIAAVQARYAAIFKDRPPAEDEMSDTGWLCLVAVPWLLAREHERQEHGDNGDANGDPRTNSIGLSQPPLKLVLPEESLSKSGLLVVSGNPVAKFLIGFLAKAVGVSVCIHGVKWPNDPSSATAEPKGDNGNQ